MSYALPAYINKHNDELNNEW